MTQAKPMSATAAPPLVGQSRCVQQLRNLIRTVGQYPCTVLIHGESGSGKEVVARQIHAHSPRAAGPFRAVDCTTLHDTLLESQLFGHKRGAFTGADRETMGFFRAADGGTLFLDEIGELDPAVQAKLLRCIQEKAVTPLGDTQPIPVDVRVLAASHKDLLQLVQEGKFREDLYFRLNVVRLDVPPLRHRLEDVPELAIHLISRIADLYEESPKALTPDALALLQSYRFPGNVRELANALEHAFVMAFGLRIGVRDLPSSIRESAPGGSAGLRGDMPAVAPLEDVLKHTVRSALEVTEGHQGRAARLLQIDRHRLYRMVKRYNLEQLTRPRR